MPPNIWNTITPTDTENTILANSKNVGTLIEIIHIQMDIIKKLEKELNRR